MRLWTAVGYGTRRFVFLRFRSGNFVDRLSAANQRTIHEVTRKGRNLHEQAPHSKSLQGKTVEPGAANYQIRGADLALNIDRDSPNIAGFKIN